MADDRAGTAVRRAGVRARWAALPGWARWVLGLYMIGFADGTGDHVRWMLHGGIHAYAAAYPAVVIQVLFVGLVVADPLTVVLAGLVRPAAVRLAAVIMMLDMLANWYGNWPRITGGRGRLLDTAPWLITAFGLFVLATAPALLHAIRSRRSAMPPSPGGFARPDLGCLAAALPQPGRAAPGRLPGHLVSAEVTLAGSSSPRPRRGFCSRW
ncbi:MAG: hypothetical protein WAK71_10640 [Streptosporangiaceae bacterium]